MGKLDAACTAPPSPAPPAAAAATPPCECRAVAVQVASEKANFETGFSLHRHTRVETRRLQAMGQLDSTCTGPHRATRAGRRGVAVQVAFEKAKA
jgi:hypothetical protein